MRAHAYRFRNSSKAMRTSSVKQKMDKHEPAALGENDLVLLNVTLRAGSAMVMERLPTPSLGNYSSSCWSRLWSMLFIGANNSQEDELTDVRAIMI